MRQFLNKRVHRGGRAAAIALAVLTAATGIAAATIPTNNVIDACYSRSGGSLRVIDSTVTKCGKNETSLAWNVEGPKGEPGEAGPAGPAGPAGSPGISGVRVKTGEELPIGTQFIKVLSTDLDAGTYAFTADVTVNGFSSLCCGGVLDVKCEIRNGTTVLGVAEERLSAEGTNTATLTLTIHAAAALTAATTEIAVWCQEDGNHDTTKVTRSQLMVLKAGSMF